MRETKVIPSLIELLAELDAQDVQGYWRFKIINEWLTLKARQLDLPESGSFELTPLCNLDCKMCYVHLNANQLKTGERLLTVDEWKEIIRQAVEAGMAYATLTGGECLTYPGFQEIYQYLFSLGIVPSVLTNGRLLTEDLIAFFVKYPPASLQVTLYGSCEEAYEKVSGHRAFQEVLDGIQRAKHAGLNLYLAITPSRYMQEDAEELLNTVHALNVPYTISASTIPARSETGREVKEFSVEVDALSRINEKEREFFSSLQAAESIKPLPRYIPPDAGKTLWGLPCGGAHSSFHVNWKGELSPCIAFSDAVHQQILEKGFMTAWNQIQQSMSGYRPPEECTKCESSWRCVTCPGEKNTGQIQGKLNPSVCEKVHRRIEDSKKTDEINAKSVYPDCP